MKAKLLGCALLLFTWTSIQGIQAAQITFSDLAGSLSVSSDLFPLEFSQIVAFPPDYTVINIRGTISGLDDPPGDVAFPLHGECFIGIEPGNPRSVAFIIANIIGDGPGNGTSVIQAGFYAFNYSYDFGVTPDIIRNGELQTAPLRWVQNLPGEVDPVIDPPLGLEIRFISDRVVPELNAPESGSTGWLMISSATMLLLLRNRISKM
jgi:hypothetical protein